MPNFDSQGIVNTLTNELALVNKWLKGTCLCLRAKRSVCYLALAPGWHFLILSL